jgi:hypothetical protein
VEHWNVKFRRRGLTQKKEYKRIPAINIGHITLAELELSQGDVTNRPVTDNF